MRAAREAVLVVAGCLALYLAGAADVPFYTRGEPREGLVAREMLRSHAWLVPARPGGELARKPPLYYWAAAGALGVLPERPELALRLPSAVLGTAAVLGTWATARAVWGAAAGLPAALVLATTFEWTRAAVSARVDMALAAVLTATLAGWTLALARGTRGATALAALGAALGTLAKGPVALVLPGLAAAGLRIARREVRPLRVVPVLGGAAALAGLWYAAAFAREGSALLDVVARENWLRFVDPEGAATGHAHAALYLVPLGLVGLLPWTPLLPLALVPLRDRRAAAALAAAWVATGVVFFSLAAAKRSVYLLPLHPAVALLLGAGVAAPPAHGRLERLASLGALLFAPAGLGLAALGGALALGVDPVPLVQPWLRPDDAAGAATLAAAARAASPWLLLLAVVTAAATPLVARAAARAEWRRLVLAVAALFALWTASFDTLLHPGGVAQRPARRAALRALPTRPRAPLLRAGSAARVAAPGSGRRRTAPPLGERVAAAARPGRAGPHRARGERGAAGGARPPGADRSARRGARPRAGRGRVAAPRAQNG
ncbi:MAG: hypothetical protein E6J60_09180 [Deltaproteobacteria bacterium]|nr:MAG: hypothetical protein E6J60_09180 [Deltaproteobacteria bacterium]